MELAKVLNSWNMTLVVQSEKTKDFCLATCSLPRKGLFIQPILPTIVMQQSVHMCQRRRKQLCFLLSMHMSAEVEETQLAKPEIIKYYNKTKGGVDTMDKMLGEYTVKRRTLR